MKVMCIMRGRWLDTIKQIYIDGPTYGEECNVTGDRVVNGELYYYLAEWPPRPGEDEDCWCSDGFVEINSGIDEAKMERKYTIQTTPA